MMRISLFSSKLSFLVIAFFAFPFIIETPCILKLWLKNVPDWSVCFFRFEIARNMLDQLTITLTSAITAEGHIKYYSIFRGCSYFLPLPVSILLFHLGLSPFWFYIVWILAWNGVGSVVVLYYAHVNCGMQYGVFFRNVVLPIIVVTCMSLMVGIALSSFMEDSFVRLLCVSCITIITFLLSTWLVALSNEEKTVVSTAVLSLVKRYKK